MRFVQVNDIASVATELATGLRKRGHEVDLLYPRLYGAELAPAWKLAISPLRFLDWLRLAWLIRRGKYDAVHIHYAYLGIVGLLAHVPYVLHCHGDDVRDVSRRTWAPLIRIAIKRAQHVYYSTPDLKVPLQAIRHDAEFLPNPIDTDLFKPTPLMEDATDVLVACALSENKGVENILNACHELLERRPAVGIHAIAGGSGTAEAQTLANVLLLMRQPRKKLPQLIGRHRVVIGQVHDGAVGMVELEALACGRPVITWFTYDEVYDEPPPFVKARSGPEITEAVLHLLDAPSESEELGIAGREWVLRHHSADQMAERVEALALRGRR
jgi:glycosyltransferase involved in cell wall biosynthesis